MAKHIGSYDFDLKPGWAAITIWKGPKAYTAIVVIDRDKRYYRKEIRSGDLEKLYYRAMAIVNRYSRDPILVESSGYPLPVKVKTEDEEIKEFAKGFLREHPEIRLAIKFGPEHKIDTKLLGSGG